MNMTARAEATVGGWKAHAPMLGSDRRMGLLHQTRVGRAPLV
jgi:hypothetical protein